MRAAALVQQCALTLLVILSSGAALGAERRAGNLEYSLGLIYTQDESVDTRRGSGIDFDDRVGLQGGFDYYLSSRLSLGFDMTWVEPNYKAVLVPDDGSDPVTVSRRSRVFTGQFNATFNLLEGPITPFIEGGLGWTYFDSRVRSEAPVVGCWYDPLWGYICADRYRTYDETNLSYGVGLGVRMDLSRNLFAKATYRWLELDLDGGRKKPMLESASVELGWRF